MEETEEDVIGLSTKDALCRLCTEIELVVTQHEISQKQKKTKSWLFHSLHHSSQHTCLNWISALAILILSTLLSIGYFASVNEPSGLLLFESFLLYSLLAISMAIQVLNNKKRHNELTTQIQCLVEKIRHQLNSIKWSSDNYPNLSTPVSPCITLQWTYRDNKIINLPWALLVRDDIIIIRPGQLSPGYCEAIDKHSEYPLLHSKEVYGPTIQNANEIFSIPKTRKPLENKKYRLLETPYLNNLRMAMEQSLERQETPINKQRYLIIVRIIEWICMPSAVALIYLINIIRFVYLEKFVGKMSSIDLFVLNPASVSLPLLPILFPLFWEGLNYFGLARFKSVFDASLQIKNIGAIVDDSFEETDKTDSLLSDSNITYKVVWDNFKTILMGRSSILPCTANILHVLGSVTTLCCVDKKGILSWPNPTAEKVFFLHNTENLSESSSLANLNDIKSDGDSLTGDNNVNNHESTSSKDFRDDSGTAMLEVLDVSYNPKDPTKLHFDDTKWQKHLNSLKPLGLAILLNTCNTATQELYSKFCSHITCEAMYNESLVPVTNRRCLCELAKEIGFLEQAQKIFALEQQLSTFRHLQPEMVRRDNKYARSLSMQTKLKFPFPHMFAVVVKELSSGSIQLLSQGTGDLILDSCTDYWDGVDLCPLTPADRKKIQDFYQRSSLTAYCSAFAYRPLVKGVSDKLSKVYLELPSDSRHLYHTHRSPTPVHWDCRSVLEPKIRTPLGPFYSTDSLLYNDSPSAEVADAESCFDMQCNQVLIGMVTMQYQAQSDMVHLIEQLEQACIRFVHFSKENELRSRVFNEKLGLESGWNCHISLLSDRNRQDAAAGASADYCAIASRPIRRKEIRRKSQSDRRLNSIDTPTNEFKNILVSGNLESSRTMSFSAPSAINMDHTVVKFDLENKPLVRQTSDNDPHGETMDMNGKSQETLENQEQNPFDKDPHDWQSMSCLTDSTEQSVPIHFDLSNRSKLPRGIDKIRPHLELIDNVPLLVSLFTDCTPASTKEMVRIMQEYEAVVCVFGSPANCENMGVFLQADASIAVEPIYPQVCQKQTLPFKDCDCTSPLELSRMLNSIACSLSFKREDPISFYNLIMLARHYISMMWNTAQFWMCCCICVTLIQLIAALFMLPAILTSGQVIWLICVVIPILSTSLMGRQIDRNIMENPQLQTQVVFNAEVVTFVLWYYGVKFLPLILFVLVSFVGMMGTYCMEVCAERNCTCVLFYLPLDRQNMTVIAGWADSHQHMPALAYAQHFILIVILLQILTISIGFVHREHNVWRRSPHSNVSWLLAVFFLLFLQIIYTLATFYDTNNDDFKTMHTYSGTILIFGLTSPLVTFIINELIKRDEIRINIRKQRRARLEFGTKLGMNSPF